MPTVPELVVDVKNFDQLRTAVRFGAGAVVLHQKKERLWLPEELEEGILFAHQGGCRVFLDLSGALNNQQIEDFYAILKQKPKIQIDAVLLSDEGLLLQMQQTARNYKIHFYPEHPVWNSHQVLFWKNQGIDRIFLPPFHNWLQLQYLIDAYQSNLEFELQIHGHLPPYPFKNLGESGLWYQEELELCCIDFMDSIIKTGVHACRIYGCLDSLHDLAILVKVYRQALDRAALDPDLEKLSYWKSELDKIKHLPYTASAYLGSHSPDQFDRLVSRQHSAYETIGKTLDYDPEKKELEILLQKTVSAGEILKILDPYQRDICMLPVAQTLDSKRMRIPCEQLISPYSLICRSPNL